MLELLSAHTWLLWSAIFLSRIADQTLDTFRTISIFRGYRFLAAFMGFLTVLIWINVAGQVIQNIGQNWYLTIVYAAGYAAGQATGLWVESKIALGHQLVRIWSRSDVNLVEQLWDRNYAMTEMQGKTKTGPIDVIFVVVKRTRVRELCQTISDLDSEAFYTVEDIKQVGLRPRDPGLALGRKVLVEMGDVVMMPLKESKRWFRKK